MRQSLLSVLLLLMAVTSYAGSDMTSRTDARDHDDDRVLALYDSSGTRIGPIVSYDFQDGVMLTINGVVLFVPVVRAQTQGPPSDIVSQNIQYSAWQLVWMSANGVYYAASNCTGTSYMSIYDAFYNYYAPSRPSIPVRAGTNVTLYIAADSPSAGTAVSSYFSNVLNRCLSFPADSLELWKSDSTFDLTGHYPEPLSAHY